VRFSLIARRCGAFVAPILEMRDADIHEARLTTWLSNGDIVVAGAVNARLYYTRRDLLAPRDASVIPELRGAEEDRTRPRGERDVGRGEGGGGKIRPRTLEQESTVATR